MGQEKIVETTSFFYTVNYKYIKQCFENSDDNSSDDDEKMDWETDYDISFINNRFSDLHLAKSNSRYYFATTDDDDDDNDYDNDDDNEFSDKHNVDSNDDNEDFIQSERCRMAIKDDEDDVDDVHNDIINNNSENFNVDDTFTYGDDYDDMLFQMDGEDVDIYTKEITTRLLATNNLVLHDHMEDAIKEHQRGSKVFQRRGNQQQYDHAKECMATLEQIDKHLDRSDVAKAKRSGKVLLNKRIKLIRIAEREGWGTVTEYLTDDLASDSEDEKHLQKAIKAAAAKQERTRKSFAAPSSKFRNAPPPSPSTKPSLRPHHSYTTAAHPSSSKTRRSKAEATCWRCGKRGHFSHECFTARREPRS